MQTEDPAKLWRDIIESDKRYNDFTIVDDPVRFTEMFAGQDISYVEVFSIWNLSGEPAGYFCGAFQWKDNDIISLDGDSYEDDMVVYAYKWIPDGEDNALLICVYDW